MALSKSDMEEIRGISRSEAMFLFTDEVKAIFTRINDDSKYNSRKMDKVAGDLANTAQTVAVLVAQTEGVFIAVQQVCELKEKIARMPIVISDEIKECQAGRDKKSKWRTSTAISILSTLIAVSALASSFFLKGCA